MGRAAMGSPIVLKGERHCCHPRQTPLGTWASLPHPLAAPMLHQGQACSQRQSEQSPWTCPLWHLSPAGDGRKPQGAGLCALVGAAANRDLLVVSRWYSAMTLPVGLVAVQV